MSSHFYPLTIKDIRKETSECISIAFDIPSHLSDLFQFHQGQYINLKTDINGSEVRRSYSICSAPYEKELRVAVKQQFNGLFSDFANTHLQKGDVLEVMPPQGKFFTALNPSSKKITWPLQRVAASHLFFPLSKKHCYRNLKVNSH